MKVHRPSENRITRGYSSSHKGYDFAGLNLPDEVRAGADGEVIERVNLYSTNWSNTGTLTTKDYGNYIKIKHTDGSFELHAHLKKGSSFIKGTKVKAGQVVARIGNTGNSTGPHLHSEYRTAGNINTSVTWITNSNPDMNELQACLKAHSEAVDAANKKDVEIKALNTLIDNLKGELSSCNTLRNQSETKVLNLDKSLKEWDQKLQEQNKNIQFLEYEVSKKDADIQRALTARDEESKKAIKLEEDLLKAQEQIIKLSQKPEKPPVTPYETLYDECILERETFEANCSQNHIPKAKSKIFMKLQELVLVVDRLIK